MYLMLEPYTKELPLCKAYQILAALSVTPSFFALRSTLHNTSHLYDTAAASYETAYGKSGESN